MDKKYCKDCLYIFGNSQWPKCNHPDTLDEVGREQRCSVLRLTFEKCGSDAKLFKSKQPPKNCNDCKFQTGCHCSNINTRHVAGYIQNCTDSRSTSGNCGPVGLLFQPKDLPSPPERPPVRYIREDGKLIEPHNTITKKKWWEVFKR